MSSKVLSGARMTLTYAGRPIAIATHVTYDIGSVWYNPIRNEFGILSNFHFIMQGGTDFDLGARAPQKLGGAKWIKLGEL